VIEFFKRRGKMSASEVGEVTKDSTGLQELSIDGRKIFKAKSILMRRSAAADGTVALAAVAPAMAGVNGSPADAEGRSAIYLVKPDGGIEAVPTGGLEGSLPLISPDGKSVAFTISKPPIEADHEHGPDESHDHGGGVEIMVYDLATRQSRTFATTEKAHAQTLVAAEWSADGRTVSILQDHGDTGGNLVMRYAEID